MKVPKETVAAVVGEASMKMSDPNYSAVLVGGFVQTQQPTAQYISTYEQDVGGAEQVVNIIFHAALIATCFQRAENRTVPSMSYEDLDRVSEGDVVAKLEQKQPALHEYITSNVEDPQVRKILCLVTLGMDLVS
ncbi:hypothetical protein [Haliangium ochraceum]|uniref:Uncharacterized protein n=1 Tax=Haliangium ochraceum (strain DSM 14365 / JCM 11303 / SMP-2) TaxID=502025 RepID=D0LH89_HALO1|nr:hypothetical protein [Haliangium ochraceum]ACY18234.1 hypothetical protein Hoch_5757 [Haliangium ochraceum DSM 14365]